MSNNKNEELVLESMHELRYFNQRLKNLSQQLSKSLDVDNLGQNRPLSFKADSADQLRTLAEGILSLSQLFTTRLDFIDVELNPQAIEQLAIEEVNIYGKFDKARRMLNSQSREKKVTVQMNAEFKKRRVFEAYTIIDILPYLLLDNAIKYSPELSNVYVEFTYYNDSTVLEISSQGPSVSKDEIELLTKKNYRGLNAKKLQKCVGRGIGLYFVDYICELHDIALKFESAPESYMLDRIPYSNFTVTLTIPWGE